MEIICICMILIIFFIYKALIVVPEGYEWVVEFLGKPQDITLTPGMHIIWPFLTKIRARVSMKEQVMDVPPQMVKTTDNITILVTSNVYYRILNPIKAVYEAQDLRKDIAYITQSNIRNLVSKMNLEEALESKEIIESQLLDILKCELEKYGCDVHHITIKDIGMPKEIRELYEKKRKMQLENTIISDNRIKYNKHNFEMYCEWSNNLKRYWENKELNKIISLFDSNISYYKNTTVRLCTIEEIKEEWQEILNEDYKRLDFNIIMQDDKAFILNIIAEERIIHDIVVKIELGSEGKCTYFRKWEENV